MANKYMVAGLAVIVIVQVPTNNIDCKFFIHFRCWSVDIPGPFKFPNQVVDV